MINWFKYLRKLNHRDQLRLLTVIDLVQRAQTQDFDVKKLSGFKDLYRIRVGKFRIIYKKGTEKNKILDVHERSDRTYNNI